MKILDVPASVLNLLALANDSETGNAWGEPEQLTQQLPPVAQFNPDMLPEPLQAWARDVAHRMQCPTDFICAMAVAMFGAVIGAACGVRPKQFDSWTEVPNVWGGIVARPGQKKSPALSEALGPLRHVEHKAGVDYDAARKAHQDRELERELTLEVKKKELKKASAIQDSEALSQLKALSMKEALPELTRYSTNDSTVEKLGEMLSKNGRGMLVNCDELVGLLHGFERQGHEGDRAFYLAAWSGLHPHRVDRLGRGETFIPRLCLSVIGGIQPDKLEEFLCATSSGGNDGLLQRFQVVVYPDAVDQDHTVDQVPDGNAADRVKAIAMELAHQQFAHWGARNDSMDGIPYFRFDAELAQPRFVAWLAQNEQLVKSCDSSLLAEHAAKYNKLVPALSLIFHLVEVADAAIRHRAETIVARSFPPPPFNPAPNISLACLDQAVRIADCLHSHAVRIYSMGRNSGLNAARALARKLQAGQLDDGFDEREVLRKGWAQLQDPQDVKAACRELEAANWIRRLAPVRAPGAGRPRSSSYEINPKIKKSKPAAN